MARLKAQEVVEMLVGLTEKSFSKGRKGKARKGHYRIARLDFLKPSGRKTLDDRSYNDIQSRMQEKGWFFLDLGDQCAITQADRMNGYRKVPKWILGEFLPEDKSDPEINKKKKGRE